MPKVWQYLTPMGQVPGPAPWTIPNDYVVSDISNVLFRAKQEGDAYASVEIRPDGIYIGDGATEPVRAGAGGAVIRSTAITGNGVFAVTSTSQQLVQENSRIELGIYNESTTVPAYLGFGVTAVVGQGARVGPGEAFVLNSFVGVVNIVAASSLNVAYYQV